MFPQTGKTTRVLQPCPTFRRGWQGRDTKEAGSRARLDSKRCQVPTSVWNDQLAGQSQWGDGVLVDQRRQRSCREGDSP